MGCYAPAPPAGLPCGPAEACPEPLVCTRGGVCATSAADAGLAADAPVGPPDGPACSDEDGDLVCDATDVCPHRADPGQADSTEVAAGGRPDGVGDACDPRPAAADRQVAFTGFTDLDPTAWSMSGPAWSIADGRLYWDDALDPSGEGGLWWWNQPLTRVTVVASARVEAVVGAAASTVAVVSAFSEPRLRYQCGTFDDVALTEDVDIRLLEFDNSASAVLASTEFGINLTPGLEVRLGLSHADGTLTCLAALGDLANLVDDSDLTLGGGFAGLRARALSASFDSVVIYEPLP